jgi:prolyl 4-hydroxylase
MKRSERMTSEIEVPGRAEQTARFDAAQTRGPRQAFEELTAWAVQRHREGQCTLVPLFQQIRDAGWSDHESVVALLRALPAKLHEQVLALPVLALRTGAGETKRIEMLAKWAAGLHAKGYSPAQMFGLLRAHDWTVEDAVAGLLNGLPHEQHPQVSMLRRLAPDPDFSRAPRSAVTIDGHTVHVLAELRNPRLVVFGNLLTPEECNELIDGARYRLDRSAVGFADDSSVSQVRTSSGMFFKRGETSLCLRIEERIAALLDWPVGYAERMQVLRYGRDQQYKPHHDYFAPPEGAWSPMLRDGGQRVGSLVIYLNTPALGGSTVFPDIPLEVRAIAGNAVFFAYDKADASSRTLHGGSPVLEGEKWAAVKWFRQGPV